MRICPILQDTPCCASAPLKVSRVTGVSTGPSSVNRHLIPCLAAPVQLVTTVLACEPGSAVRSKKPPPSLHTTSVYSDCVDSLRPNNCRVLTAQGAPAPAVIIDATIAYTSLLPGSLQKKPGSLPFAT